MHHCSTHSPFTVPSLGARIALAASRRHRRGRHAKRSLVTHGATLAVGGAAIAATTVTITVIGAAGSPAVAVAGPDGRSSSTPSARITAAPTPTPAPDPAPVIDAVPAVASGPVTGGTTVTIEGSNLTAVASATVGGRPAAVVSSTPDAVAISVPAAVGYAEGSATIDVFDAAGAKVPVQIAPPATVAGVALSGPPLPALSFTYVPDERITAQADYLLRYWSSYNPDYVELPGIDCANFASQGLIARGWTMDADWWYSGGATSPAWVSSTAFSNYLAAHPERATLLGDDRSGVKVGDIVQFDWDDSGDLDHTTTVSRVERTADGITVFVAGHTKDSDYWDIDQALATGGGRLQIWSIH